MLSMAVEIVRRVLGERMSRRARMLGEGVVSEGGGKGRGGRGGEGSTGLRLILRGGWWGCRRLRYLNLMGEDVSAYLYE